MKIPWLSKLSEAESGDVTLTKEDLESLLGSVIEAQTQAAQRLIADCLRSYNHSVSKLLEINKDLTAAVLASKNPEAAALATAYEAASAAHRRSEGAGQEPGIEDPFEEGLMG